MSAEEPSTAKKAPGNAPAKKPVGRPRKNTSVGGSVIAGIVAAPTEEKNVCELIHNNAQIFKTIAQLAKNYSASECSLMFLPAGMLISYADHTGHVKVTAFADGRAMISYYCRAPMVFRASVVAFNKNFGAIRKHHDRITLSVSSARKNTLLVSLHDPVYSNTTIMDIPVPGSTSLEDPPTYSSAAAGWDVVLRFTMCSKYFKNIIPGTGDKYILRINKQAGAPLCVDSETGKGLVVKNIYADDTKLQLEHNTKDDNEIFSVSFGIEKIRPFANIAAGKTVTFLAHNGPSVLFVSTADKCGACSGITVEVLVDINGLNPV